MPDRTGFALFVSASLCLAACGSDFMSASEAAGSGGTSASTTTVSVAEASANSQEASAGVGGNPSAVGGGGSSATASSGSQANNSASSSSSSSTSGSGGGGPCPAGMVHVTLQQKLPFCIDATEVTREDWAKFMATNPDPVAYANAIKVCNWKGYWGPNKGAPGCAALPWPPAVSDLNKPMSCVDQCDARFYCKWQKKRLCHADGGYAGEWQDACWASGPGVNNWPYGSAYAAGSCNDANGGQGAASIVASFSKCKTMHGAYDTTGNVSEWTDWSNATMGIHVGGSFKSASNNASCTAGAYNLSSFSSLETGFRCCVDP